MGTCSGSRVDFSEQSIVVEWSPFRALINMHLACLQMPQYSPNSDYHSDCNCCCHSVWNGLWWFHGSSTVPAQNRFWYYNILSSCHRGFRGTQCDNDVTSYCTVWDLWC